MAPQTQKTYIISWRGDDLGIPIVLVSDKEGQWLPPKNFPIGLIKLITTNNKLRKNLSQICFGFFFVGFSLLFSPSRVRAMQSTQAVVSQAILERPTDEARMECLFKRRNHLLFVSRKNPRAHPTIEAEVFERGMRHYDPNITQVLIHPSRLWSLPYPLCKYCDRLQLETYRLGSLIYYRENTVLRYIISTEPHEPKRALNQDDKSTFPTKGGDIEESIDNAISVQMKSVAVAILADRRKQDELNQNQIDRMQNALFWEAKRLKENTENLILKSQCEIREALNQIKQSADSE